MLRQAYSHEYNIPISNLIQINMRNVKFKEKCAIKVF